MRRKRFYCLYLLFLCGIDELLKFCFAESAAPRTALMVAAFIAPEVFIAGRAAGNFQGIAAISAFDFSG